MASDTLATASRFAGLHAGFKLVDYEEVGLPLFHLRLDVMALERHELPIIDEYVLRAAKLGLVQPNQISGFLGLGSELVQQSVLALLQSDHVDYVPGPNGRQVALTPAGTAVLEDRLLQLPQRTEISIGFDRLLWQLSTRWMRDWDNPRAFKQAGARLISPRHKRRPDLRDVDSVSVNRLLSELPARPGTPQQDVIQVLDVSARTKYLAALLLVFVAEDGSAMRASFVIDQHHSPAHDLAFSDIDGLERLGLTLADDAEFPAVRPDVTPELETLGSDPGQAERLESRLRATARALDAAVTAAAVDEVVEVVSPDAGTTRERLVLREQEISALQLELEKLRVEQRQLPIRAITTYEHKELLQEALGGTSARLLIIAPWIKSAVVSEDFADKLRSLLEQGRTIHIGYGIEKNDKEGHDPEALKRLRVLQGAYSNFVLRDIGHTHAKVLVWDTSLIVTSFNWLSFRGDKRKRYRQEEGTLVTAVSYVDREYERHRTAIERAS